MDEPDKKNGILLDALRKALGSQSEQRLFRRGKIDGLFPQRGGEAASEALREGYLESIRRETTGKMEVEWVQLTPKGVEFLYQHDSPQAILSEMSAMLHSAKSGVPTWLDSILEQLKALADHFGTEMQRYQQKLDVLTHRVDEALRRSDAGVPGLSPPINGIVPWGWEALTYLDHRKLGGAAAECPLSELFAAVKAKRPELTIIQFHDGLRKLAENRAIKLLPFLQPADQLPAPEYALLDGSRVLYYAKR